MKRIEGETEGEWYKRGRMEGGKKWGKRKTATGGGAEWAFELESGSVQPNFFTPFI